MHLPSAPQAPAAHSVSALHARHAFESQIGAVSEQSLFATHCTHALALHTGVGAAQSLLITHCTQLPFEQIASSALPPNPGHSESVSQAASHKPVLVQNGSCALQSALLEHVSATHEFAMQTSPSEHM